MFEWFRFWPGSRSDPVSISNVLRDRSVKKKKIRLPHVQGFIGLKLSKILKRFGLALLSYLASKQKNSFNTGRYHNGSRFHIESANNFSEIKGKPVIL